MYAKIIKILNASLIFSLLYLRSCVIKIEPHQPVVAVHYEIEKQYYDFNEDINITILIGAEPMDNDSTIAYVSMINRKYEQSNPYARLKDIYQREEAHLIKVLDDFCPEKYPYYYLKKGCKRQWKYGYSFESFIPKDLFEDSEGQILVVINWGFMNNSMGLTYEIKDGIVKLTKWI